MNAIRIIPCLDVDAGRVVKGVKFAGIRDAGDPVTLAERYNAGGADEITFLDIGATHRSRAILRDIVEAVSRRVFVPLTVGGGIRTAGDMQDILRAGADKVSVCSAALCDPALLTEGARRFGSQCIVLSIDAKRHGDSWHAYKGGGRTDSGRDAVAWAVEAVERGAGEILLNSIDADGTQAGYDLDLLRRVGAAVPVPVIASGGAGKLEHFAAAVRDGKADALLLASLLHDGVMTIRQIKEYLRNEEVTVRC
ncbi:MAG TPA: imidazole glycerol phosphate synthase subunit HisF [bacterium]|nr:imidazole glycerol phosphate synthase subunit HisF [bacterium]